MNIIKFKDIWFNLPDHNTDESTWKDQSYIGDMIRWGSDGIVEDQFLWDPDKIASLDLIDPRLPLAYTGLSPEELANYFNENFRNKYTYVINWKMLIPISINTGNPWDIHDDTYIYYSIYPNTIPIKIDMNCFDSSWYDQATSLKIMHDEQIKCEYLNEFTPDDDITIDELKKFRTWLASILLANEPLINERSDKELLVNMLSYYKQGMTDVTVKMLGNMTPYMEQHVIVAGDNKKNMLGISQLAYSAGCGCNNSQTNYAASSNSVCDPINIYRTSIYNYMVKVFSDISYWAAQKEICAEMKKYIEGILKAGLPLSSKIIDPFADCTCSSTDTDMEARYHKMLEQLSVALGYIIDSNIDGNRNFISSSFNNWAVYLYENMWWA